MAPIEIPVCPKCGWRLHPNLNGEAFGDYCKNPACLAKCEHAQFACEVDVNRMPAKEGGPIERYSADVRVKRADCGKPFRFVGLPCGVDLNGAAVSIDGCEARLAIAPKGEVITPIEGVTGFTARRTA